MKQIFDTQDWQRADVDQYESDAEFMRREFGTDWERVEAEQAQFQRSNDAFIEAVNKAAEQGRQRRRRMAQHDPIEPKDYAIGSDVEYINDTCLFWFIGGAMLGGTAVLMGMAISRYLIG